MDTTPEYVKNFALRLNEADKNVEKLRTQNAPPDWRTNFKFPDETLPQGETGYGGSSEFLPPQNNPSTTSSTLNSLSPQTSPELTTARMTVPNLAPKPIVPPNPLAPERNWLETIRDSIIGQWNEFYGPTGQFMQGASLLKQGKLTNIDLPDFTGGAYYYNDKGDKVLYSEAEKERLAKRTTEAETMTAKMEAAQTEWAKANPQLSQFKSEWQIDPISAVKEGNPVVSDPSYWTYKLTQSAVYSLTTMAATAVGGPLLGTVVSGLPMYKEAYDAIIEAGGTKEQARQIGFPVAVVNGAIEAYVDMAILGQIAGGVKSLAGKELKGALVKAVSKETLRRLLLKGTLTFTQDEIMESVQEVMQEFSNNFGAWMVNKKVDVTRNLYETFANTLVSSAPSSFFGAAGGTISAARRMGIDTSAAKAGAELKQAGEFVAKAPLMPFMGTIGETGQEAQQPAVQKEVTPAVKEPWPAEVVPPVVPPEKPTAGIPPVQPPNPPVPPIDNYQRLVDALNPKKPSVKDSITIAKDALLRKFYADWYPLRKLSRDTGVPADKLIQVVPGSTAAGEDLIRQHFIPAYQPVAKDARFLEQYMVLRRNEDILARNPKALLPGGIQGAIGNTQAMATLKNKIGATRFAALEASAAKLWAANTDYALKPLLDNGLLSQEAYDAILANNPHYIPFQRLDFTDSLGRSFTRPEANVTANGIQKMMLEGSERALDQPLARMQAQIIKSQNLIARNKAAKSIVEALKVQGTNTNTKLATLVKEGVEHSAILDTVSYFEDGKKVTYQVPAIYGTIAKSLDQESGNILLNIIRTMTLPLRMGATTYNPAFLIVNPIRDGMSALYREKLIPLSPEYIRGWIAVIKKDALFSEAAQNGVLMSGIIDTMRSTEAMKRVSRMGSITVQTPADALLVIPRLIERANLIGEEATRVATYGKLRAQGIDALEAAVRARDVTVDFSKSGTVMKVINQVIPFSNAGVQGAANIGRTMRDKPGWAIAVGVSLGLASLLCRVNNKRFPTSKEIPEYEYTNYWVIQFGEITKSDGAKAPLYIKIPKSTIGSVFTFPVEALFNYAEQQNDRSVVEAVLQAGLGATETVSPVGTDVSGLLTPPLDTAASIAGGSNLYTGLPLVPRGEQARLPEQQYGADTSAVAVALGKQFKISPRIIDFAIKDYAAGTGQTVLWLLDLGLNALGYNPEVYGAQALPSETTTAEALSQAPVTSRFVGTKNTQSERVGWDEFNKVSAETNRLFSDIPDTNRLGIRLGEVGGSIKNVELSPSQRAEYQREIADVVIPAITAYVTSDAYQKITSDELKKKIIGTMMTKIKQSVADKELLKVLKEMPAITPSPTPLYSTPTPSYLPTEEDWRSKYAIK